MVGITSETSEVQGTTSQTDFLVVNVLCARPRTGPESRATQAARSFQHEHARIPSLGETSLSFLRLLSKELSCHLVIFLATAIANDKGRSKKKKVGTPRVVSGRRRPHASYASASHDFVTAVLSRRTLQVNVPQMSASCRKCTNNDCFVELHELSKICL